MVWYLSTVGIYIQIFLRYVVFAVEQFSGFSQFDFRRLSSIQKYLWFIFEDLLQVRLRLDYVPLHSERSNEKYHLQRTPAKPTTAVLGTQSTYSVSLCK